MINFIYSFMIEDNKKVHILIYNYYFYALISINITIEKRSYIPAKYNSLIVWDSLIRIMIFYSNIKKKWLEIYNWI